MSTRRFFRLFFCLILWNCPIAAQETGGAISGLVRDETEAVLPGVTMTVVQVETGAARTVVTDDRGRYRAPGLALGDFEIRAELSGFQTTIRKGISLSIGREAIVDFTLKIGALAETVTVSGEAPLVETRRAELAELVSRDKIDTLPLNGRSFQQLAIMQPGTFVSTKARSDASRGKGTKINAAGTRHNFSQFLLDGVEMMDPRNTSPASFSGSLLGVDTVREFKVLTSAYSAEYGRNAGAVILISTRSGTNEFHGSAYEFHRNDNLDARNFFDRTRPEFKRNQFGFTFDGPIIKNSTFFLGNYEGLRERLGVTNIGTVADADARRGIIPGIAPFAVAPEVRPYLDLWPLPNGRIFGNGVGEFAWSGSNPTNDNYFTVRIDHSFSEKDSLFGRYTFDEAEVSATQNLPLWQRFDRSRSQNAVLEEDRIFTPKLLNQARFGYNRVFRLSDIVPRASLPATLTNRPGQRQGQISITGTTGFEGPGQNPQSDLINTFDIADNLSYAQGSHDLKFGLNIKRFQFRRLAVNRIHPTYSFDSLLDFLTLTTIGEIRAAPTDIEPTRHVFQSLFGFYIQDNWTAFSNLTLNLGFRYEFITVPTEGRGLLGSIRDPLKDTQAQSGPGFSIFRNPSLKNFGPRIGFAWDPLGNGKTSIRGGYGIFYDQLLMGSYAAFVDDIPPFGGEVNLLSVPARSYFPIMPESAFARIPGSQRGGVHDYYASTPYVMQYNLSIQRELSSSAVLTVAYAGSRGVHLQRETTPNISRFEIRNGAKFFPVGAPRLNPNFDQIDYYSTDANSFFNSLQVGFNRRFANGFSLQTAYNLGKAIDDMSQVSARTYIANLTLAQDPFDRTDNRALADFDVRQSFVINGIYDLPLGAGGKLASGGGGVAGKLLEGWQVAGIATFVGGAPISVELGFDRARSTQRSGQRPLLVGNNNNPTHPGNPDSYFDVEAFGLPPAGFIGDPGRVGRNTMIGPGLATLDFSLLKNTSIAEQVKIQFRAEIFNLANRANFQVPGTAVTGGIRPLNSRGQLIPQSSRISETAGTARQIQFGLKLLF